MQYELTNVYYGTKIIAPSEKSKDHILKNCKTEKKTNKPVWKVTKELPDGYQAPKFTVDQLKAMLAEAEVIEQVVDKPKRGRPAKQEESNET